MLKGQAAPGRVRKTLRLAFGATEALRNRSSQLRLKALLVASALCAENLLKCVDICTAGIANSQAALV